MASTYSLEKAAQAWCTDKTSSTVMDSDLAIAFADILDREVEARTRHILDFYCSVNPPTR